MKTAEINFEYGIKIRKLLKRAKLLTGLGEHLAASPGSPNKGR